MSIEYKMKNKVAHRRCLPLRYAVLVEIWASNIIKMIDCGCIVWENGVKYELLFYIKMELILFFPISAKFIRIISDVHSLVFQK